MRLQVLHCVTLSHNTNCWCKHAAHVGLGVSQKLLLPSICDSHYRLDTTILIMCVASQVGLAANPSDSDPAGELLQFRE